MITKNSEKALLFVLLMWLVHLAGASIAPHIPVSSYGFIQNKGQIVDQYLRPNPAVLYLYNGNGLNVQLKKGGFSYEVIRTESKSNTSHTHPVLQEQLSYDTITAIHRVHRVDIHFIGADPHQITIPLERAHDYLNYYTPGDSEAGVLGVSHYKRVLYKNIYPHIDIEFIIGGENHAVDFKYNFIVHPGGDVKMIRVKYEGADSTFLGPTRFCLLPIRRLIRKRGRDTCVKRFVASRSFRSQRKIAPRFMKATRAKCCG